MRPISEIIADRMLATVPELGSMVLADAKLKSAASWIEAHFTTQKKAVPAGSPADLVPYPR